MPKSKLHCCLNTVSNPGQTHSRQGCHYEQLQCCAVIPVIKVNGSFLQMVMGQHTGMQVLQAACLYDMSAKALAGFLALPSVRCARPVEDPCSPSVPPCCSEPFWPIPSPSHCLHDRPSASSVASHSNLMQCKASFKQNSRKLAQSSDKIYATMIYKQVGSPPVRPHSQAAAAFSGRPLAPPQPSSA